MAACMPAIEQALSRAVEHTRRTGRPLVTLSYAQSLDGSLALKRGAPMAISSPETQRLTHQIRSQHDAILVGVGTVLADDPRLNVRLASGRDPQPVVLDSTLRIPGTARLFSGARKPWIACKQDADKTLRARLEALGAQVLVLPADPGGGVSLPDLLSALAQRGICSLMIEGGAQVITRFLANRLVDQAVITVAPFFAGGLAVIESPLAQLSGRVAALPRIHPLEFARVGADLVLWGTMEYS
jgi:GTP cyclohydrolase II